MGVRGGGGVSITASKEGVEGGRFLAQRVADAVRVVGHGARLQAGDLIGEGDAERLGTHGGGTGHDRNVPATRGVNEFWLVKLH